MFYNFLKPNSIHFLHTWLYILSLSKVYSMISNLSPLLFLFFSLIIIKPAANLYKCVFTWSSFQSWQLHFCSHMAYFHDNRSFHHPVCCDHISSMCYNCFLKVPSYTIQIISYEALCPCWVQNLKPWWILFNRTSEWFSNLSVIWNPVFL